MNYAVVVGGTIENVVVAEYPIAANWVLCPPEFHIGDTYVDGVFHKSQAESVVPVVPPWTKKEFLLKFTPAEYAGIIAATKTNAVLDYYWQIFMVADNVLKTDPVTIGGVTALEAEGLLAPGRAAEILA